MRLLVLATLLAIAGTAHAQYNVPAQATGSSQRQVLATDDVTVIAQPDPKPAPQAYELGASLDFLTRDRAPGEVALKFTDVVLFRVHALLAVGSRAEVFTGIDLLPKQPSYTDELAWQGVLMGGRAALTKHLSAYVRGHAGPMLDRTGYWGIAEAAGKAQVLLAENVLFWDSILGATYTRLLPEEDGRDELWQTELLAQTGLAIRERKGVFAAWLTFGFHFPLAVGRELDPQTRVSMQLGTLLGITRSLDLFLEYQILDRGDFVDPATTLPILAGGFDQRRVVFGFNRRFGGRKR